MTDNQQHIERLITLVRRRSAFPLSTVTNLHRLASEIQVCTGESLSVSTLRRLLGMMESHHDPSIATLDILSRFAGFRGWHDFIAHAGDAEAQSQFLNGQVLRCDQLDEGTIVEVEWPPARLCRLRCQGFGRFEVLLSLNSKLAEGDTLMVQVLSVGQPMVATDIGRGPRREKVYVAGRDTGITSLRVTKVSQPARR